MKEHKCEHLNFNNAIMPKNKIRIIFRDNNYVILKENMCGHRKYYTQILQYFRHCPYCGIDLSTNTENKLEEMLKKLGD